MFTRRFDRFLLPLKNSTVSKFLELQTPRALSGSSQHWDIKKSRVDSSISFRVIAFFGRCASSVRCKRFFHNLSHSNVRLFSSDSLPAFAAGYWPSNIVCYLLSPFRRRAEQPLGKQSSQSRSLRDTSKPAFDNLSEATSEP